MRGGGVATDWLRPAHADAEPAGPPVRNAFRSSGLGRGAGPGGESPGTPGQGPRRYGSYVRAASTIAASSSGRVPEWKALLEASM